MKTLIKSKKGAIGRGMQVVFLVMFVAIAAGIIWGNDGLNATAYTSNSPSWLQSLLPLAVGFTLIGLVYRSR